MIILKHGCQNSDRTNRREDIGEHGFLQGTDRKRGCLLINLRIRHSSVRRNIAIYGLQYQRAKCVLCSERSLNSKRTVAIHPEVPRLNDFQTRRIVQVRFEIIVKRLICF